MPDNHFLNLLAGFYNRTQSPDETAELIRLLHDPRQKELLDSIFADSLSNKENVEAPETLAFIYRQIELRNGLGLNTEPESFDKKSSIQFLQKGWLRYAAAVLLIFGLGAYLYYFIQKKETVLSNVQAVGPARNILPGGDKATLTLSDGSTIILDSAANGKLAQQNGVQIVKIANGQMEYQLTGAAVNSTLSLNTMRTPKGGQYQLRLPDGTKVWLNAASSITYPISFTGKTRTVKMEGEAYFEVAKDMTRPFYVEARDSKIEVLGTHFNVNAYADEPDMKTTLLEGSIRVKQKEFSSLLRPGQQAVLTDHIELRDKVNVDESIAWKNGAFYFDQTDLTAVMRQLSRWYDVDIIYPKGQIHKKIKGEVGRDLNLAEMLEGLKGFGIEFRIDGKKLNVFPK